MSEKIKPEDAAMVSVYSYASTLTFLHSAVS